MVEKKRGTLSFKKNLNNSGFSSKKNSKIKKGISKKKITKFKAKKQKFTNKILSKKIEDARSSLRKNKKSMSLGEQISDWLTKWAGSWTFIIGFGVFLVAWMGANAWMLVYGWDPYPYILLNLVLSCLAALQAPIILMSQNRTAILDRNKSELDYMVNRKAERENVQMMEDLQKIKRHLGIE